MKQKHSSNIIADRQNSEQIKTNDKNLNHDHIIAMSCNLECRTESE